MKFKNFDLSAEPVIQNAYCKCGHLLTEMPNGWFSSVWYCEKCDNVYKLKLVKVPDKKVSKRFLEQCHKKMRLIEESKTGGKR